MDGSDITNLGPPLMDPLNHNINQMIQQSQNEMGPLAMENQENMDLKNQVNPEEEKPYEKADGIIQTTQTMGTDNVQQIVDNFHVSALFRYTQPLEEQDADARSFFSKESEALVSDHDSDDDMEGNEFSNAEFKNLWIGGRFGQLKNWCLNLNKEMVDYGQIMSTDITSQETSPNKCRLFQGDQAGNLLQLNILTKTIMEKNGTVINKPYAVPIKQYHLQSGCIRSIKAISNEEIQVCGLDGPVRKIDTVNYKVVQEYYATKIEAMQSNLIITKDRGSFICGGDWGYLKEYSIIDGRLISDFSHVCKKKIGQMAQTPDDKYLFVTDGFGYLYMVSVLTAKLARSFGRVTNSWIRKICIDERQVWLGNEDGTIYKYQIDRNKWTRQTEKYHQTTIDTMLILWNKWQLVADRFGNQVMWNIRTDKKGKIDKQFRMFSIKEMCY